MAIPNELLLLGCPVAAFFAIIFYYLAIANSKNYAQAFLNGFLQGLTTHLMSSFWLGYFKDFAIFTLGASALATACIAGFMALYLYLPFSRTEYPLYDYSAKLPFYKKPHFRVIYFAATYTAYEWVKSSGFIGYPWGTVSSAMFRFPIFMQLSSITGTYGITFITVFINCLIGEYFLILKKGLTAGNKKELLSSFNSAALVCVTLFALSLLYGAVEYYKPRIPVKTLQTILVQQNADPWISSSDSGNIKTSERLTEKAIKELEEEGEKPELVVWSEGVLTRRFPQGYSIYQNRPASKPLVDFIKESQTPFLIGGSYSEVAGSEEEGNKRTKYYNSALMFDKDGLFRGYYAKLHLVPFAEEIPGINYPFINKLLTKLVGISAGWNHGEQLVYFDIPCTPYGTEPVKEPVVTYDMSLNSEEAKKADNTTKVKIATPICFDDSFTDVIRPLYLNGAELFVNLTDDSWSLKKSSEYQHCIIASYRAIEYRTTLVRSTNSGWSVVIDPSGRVLTELPLFEEASGHYNVPIYPRTKTVYARYGNWLAYACVIFIFLTALLMKKNFKKSDWIAGTKRITLKRGE